MVAFALNIRNISKFLKTLAMMNEEEMLAEAIALSLQGVVPTQQPTSVNGSRQEQAHTTIRGSAPDLVNTAGHRQPDLPKGPGHPHSHSTAKVRGTTLEPSSGATLPAAKLSSLHSVQDWQPNQQCLELIVGMGISQNAARRALYHTGNDNAELAVAWVYENIENPELHLPFEPPMVTVAHLPQMGPVYHSFDELVASDEDEEEELYKMVFVVNTELKMGVGKVAAQVGHATLGLYSYLQAQQECQAGVKAWQDAGSKKIVLRGNSAQELLDLKRRAYELHIPNIIVHDAGRTQVQAGSLTVFALFGQSLKVDQVTGKLKLL